jgi:GNAT superfamily N-acetyltransferase
VATRLLKLGLSDVEHMVALAATMGWESTIADWDTIVFAATVWGHRDERGALISCGALFDFGETASIGRMMVHPDHRRRGLGQAILTQLLAARSDPHVPTSLSATAEGAFLYARAGFREVGAAYKMIARAPARAAGAFSAERSPAWRVEQLPRGRFAEALAFDRAVFGADRSCVLLPRAAQASVAKVVRAPSGELAGYGLAVRRGDLTIIGPVLAEQPAGAALIVEALVAEAPSGVRIDVPEGQTALRAALRACGAEELDRRVAMVLGQLPRAASSQNVFALAGHDFG